MGKGVIGNGPVGGESLESRALSATPAADSIGYKIWELEKHFHTSEGSKVYPTGATPVTITSDGAASTYGAWTEIIPASTIAKKFDPHLIWVAAVNNANRVFRLQLGAGGAGSEALIGEAILGKETNNKSVSEFTVFCGRVDANTRIAARVMDDTGGGSVSIFLGYHEYIPAGLQ